MKIAIVNHYAGSRLRGMEHRHYCLARHWTRAGHEAHVFAGSYSHLRLVNPESGQVVFSEEEDGIRFHYLKTPSYSGNGIGKVASMLAFSRRLGSIRAAFRGMDLVLVSSPHLFAIPAVQSIARSFGLPVVVEIRDLWPLSLVELLGLPAWHPLVLAMKWVERRAYRDNDLLVSLLPKAADYFARYGADPRNIVYIPNGVEPEGWDERIPGDHPTLQSLGRIRQAHGFVFMYLGTIGRANALEPFLEAARLAEDSGTAFVLVGSGHQRQLLASGQPGNVHFLDPVPRSLVPAALACADVLYLGMQDCPTLYRYGISPNKIMDYMMAARPVIQAVKAGNDPVAEAGCGISIPPGQPQAIAEAIRTLQGLGAGARAAMGDRGRDYILRQHNYRVLAEHYLAEFERVLQARRRGTTDSLAGIQAGVEQSRG